MTDRPRLSEPQATFRHATPLSRSIAGPGGADAPIATAPLRLLMPPRLIVPASASATVKQSLWVFRTPKLELLKD